MVGMEYLMIKGNDDYMEKSVQDWTGPQNKHKLRNSNAYSVNLVHVKGSLS